MPKVISEGVRPQTLSSHFQLLTILFPKHTKLMFIIVSFLKTKHLALPVIQKESEPLPRSLNIGTTKVEANDISTPSHPSHETSQ